MPLISHYLFSVCRRFHVIFYQFILDSHYFLPVYCWCYIISDQFTAGSPRNGKLRTQKWKPHLVRTQSLNVLPLKPGGGQYIAIYATLTARDFFLAYFYPSGPFTCIFSKTSPDFFSVLAVANSNSSVDPRNKIGQPAHRYIQLMQVPALSPHGI